MRGSRKSILVVAAMATLLVFALGAAAGASTGQDGPSAGELGDPVAGNTVPHAGYDSASNFCMQCHDIHGDVDTGEYALMTERSVTATCETCHTVGTTGPTGASLGGPGGGDLGTVSSRTVYDVSGTLATHGIGNATGMITSSEWDYDNFMLSGDSLTTGIAGTASETGGGGIYCAACHTPHGDFGQLVNNWTGTDDGATQVWWTDPTDLTGDTHVLKTLYLNGANWEVCDSPSSGCAPATERDAEGQLVSLFGYKLLSAHPNHTYSTVQSYNTEQYNQDSADWCTACHTSQGSGGTFHNHPGGCVGCHGNPDTGLSSDFPHSSTTDMFLTNYPDALCVTCHGSGTLP